MIPVVVASGRERTVQGTGTRTTEAYSARMDNLRRPANALVSGPLPRRCRYGPEGETLERQPRNGAPGERNTQGVAPVGATP